MYKEDIVDELVDTLEDAVIEAIMSVRGAQPEDLKQAFERLIERWEDGDYDD